MPKLSQHHSCQIIKALIMGESGTGKTGGLASLAAAGYNLRIADLEDGLAPLFNILQSGKYPREAIERVDYFSITDPRKNVGGQPLPIAAKAWPKLISMLSDWSDGDSKFGPIAKWGPKDILVLDTTTSVSRAAHTFNLSLQQKIGQTLTQNEARRMVWGAQTLVENLIQMLCDVNVGCNVIVNSHITYVDDQDSGPMLEGERRPQHGFPSAIGKALSPKLPPYFNTVLLAKPQGAKLGLHTKTQGVVLCKNPAPFKVKPFYPIETGWADLFKDLQSTPVAAAAATPTQETPNG
jgi:hypothetical protein